MLRWDTATELRTMTDGLSWVEPDEGALLAAALAATLVEYRRYVGQSEGHLGPAGAKANWRMAARLEQLRGRL
jgi:hypothetical protein